MGGGCFEWETRITGWLLNVRFSSFFFFQADPDGAFSDLKFSGERELAYSRAVYP